MCERDRARVPCANASVPRALPASTIASVAASPTSLEPVSPASLEPVSPASLELSSPIAAGAVASELEQAGMSVAKVTAQTTWGAFLGP